MTVLLLALTPIAGSSQTVRELPPWRARVRELRLALSGPRGMEAARELVGVLEELEPRVARPERLPGDPEFEDEGRAFVSASGLIVRAVPALCPRGRSPQEQARVAYAVALRLEDREPAAFLAPILADMLWAEGHAQEATAVLDDVLAKLPASEPRRTAVLAKRARYELMLDRFETATATLDGLAAELARVPSDWGGRTQVEGEFLGLEAERARKLGLLEQAERRTEELEAFAERCADPVLQVEAALQRAALYLALGRYAALERHARAMRAADAAAADPQAAARLEFLLGVGQVARGRVEPEHNAEALATMTSAIESGCLPPEQELLARLWRVELLLRTGAREEASGELRELRQRQNGRHPTTLGGVDDQTLMAVVAHRVARAGASSADERRRLLEGMRETLRGFLDAWREVTPEEGGLGILHYATRRAFLSELIDLALDVEGPERGARTAFEALQSVQALGSFARTRGYEPASLESVRSLLAPEGCGLLILLPGPDRSHLLALDADGLTHFALPPAGQLNELREAFVRAVRSAARTGDEAAFEAVLARDELGPALLPQPVRQRVRSWRGMTLVGFDMLGHVPAEVMSWTAAGGRRTTLGRRFALSHLPSIPTGVLLARQHTPATHPARAILIGAPPPADGRASIPLSEADAGRLLFGFAPDSEMLLGRHATLAGLTRALSNGRPSPPFLLHVVAHGVQRESLHPAGFALAPPGAARATAENWGGSPAGGLVFHPDLMALAQAASFPSVVTLCVCQAGAPAPRRGEDLPPGLAATFLDCGSEVVVLPRFEVELQAGVEVLARFDRHLVHGLSAAEALRRARDELAKDGKPQHPSYQLLQVVGLGLEPLLRAN